MDLHDIILNILAVCGFTLVIAKTINFSQESREKAFLKEKERVRQLHISALRGDPVAAQAWSDIKAK